MAEATHVLDPRGDVLITLHNPMARWEHPNVTPNPSKTTDGPTFLCSSTLLIKASPIFRLSLQGLSLEPLHYSSEVRTLIAEEFDEMAFWQVLTAIHLDGELPEDVLTSRTWGMSSHAAGPLRHMPLSRFAQVALVVDYYQCVDAIDAFAKVWFADMAVPSAGSMKAPELEMLVFLAWLFRDPTILGYIGLIAVRDLDAPLEANSFPIPDCVTDVIIQRRCEVLSRLVDLPAGVRKQLEDPADRIACAQCKPELISMLDTQMHGNGLTGPQAAESFVGTNCRLMEETVSSFYQPRNSPWTLHY